MIMSSTSSNHVPDDVSCPESFGGFFETWLQEQERDLEELKAAMAHSESTRSLQDRVDRIMSHYEKYYRVKSESTKKDVLEMLTPSWRSHLEESFLWIGGWRPSTAFHLLYSLSGIHFEARFSELLRGLRTGVDLGDLSQSQLRRVDELQGQTIREERELTETLAAHQETVADTSMVELSHIATELMRDSNSQSSGRAGTDLVNERVESTLDTKEEKFKEILEKADDLRLRTLRNVVDILSPIQAVHFLIAAAELHLRVHEWGMKKDANAH
ncbi:protein DOG1-like 3 [Spinacia oleracea]|uniref:Protein DOG1-like 3 n=1 Tax=Spinacia oleracea TaxID=3562 RepID=A0A9R0J9Q1_SPIOL|nr:protein DOG1-like 3 [Spinacia oleracea]